MSDPAPLPDMPPWEPPLAGSEVDHLLGSLDRLRATFRWKAGGLDASELSAKLASSALTLGGLLKHLAFVEDHSSTVRLSGGGAESARRSTRAGSTNRSHSTGTATISACGG
jgi:hypothetical protein